MKPFLDEHFLLQNDVAQTLYHNYAKSIPIIDYHCHLSPKEIYENASFSNLTEAWLAGDHYKWRAMRANGAVEELVTGGEGVSDYDRFAAYAAALPQAIGNPLYHWSHLELQRYFGVDDVINASNAPHIWEKVNAKLATGKYQVRDLIHMSNVSVICTTDDPIDSLEYHKKIKELEHFDVQVLPSFRPDKALEINKEGFSEWISALGEVVGREVHTYDVLLGALSERIDYFHEVGCKVSDHGMDYVPYCEATKEEAAQIFLRKLNGEAISLKEEQQYKTVTFLHMAKQYAKLGWAMQLHMNPTRNNNTRMYKLLGADRGFDAINDAPVAAPLKGLLDALEQEDLLPKTIVYSLNANDNEILAALIGCFQGGGVAGKMQLGSAWWFNDTKKGMIAQLESLASFGLLGQFVGMLTDSRSFLSFTRHEYFRRILCNVIGTWVEQGELPYDEEELGKLVQNISYYNAKRYFNF
ncbi:glucuronate isomerase [Paenibacillus septentrionalis]|uniref:Uronate isomerase n=1 Tax=Paenibacillus septentrionalis TaxID=429342 RepID=A0ABW1UZX9_9BACL